MAEPILMPKQGQSVESCIITEWYKSKGDKVSAGDLLFAYETDKASFDEEAKTEGILLELFYEQGDEVPVLTNVGVIGQEGESVDEFRPGKEDSETTEESPSAETSEVQAPPASPEVVKPEAQDTTGKEVKISPRAKRMAEQESVPYQSVSGSGPNGRIIVRDIEEAIAKGIKAAPAPKATPSAPAPQPPEESINYADFAAPEDMEFEVENLSNMRKLIAKSMYASLQNSAQLTHHLSADARKILALRKKVKAMQKEGFEQNITLNDMICFATIRALQKNKDANVHFLGDSVRKFKKIHLGLAVDTERGLMVPVLKNADDFSLTGLSSQLKSLADRARSGKIDPDLLASTSGSFTISNLGNYGVEMFTPIINLPQAAILGVNTIVNRPAQLEGGTFGFVPYLGLSLTYDHRALDGGPATKFLADIKTEIENLNTDLS